MTVFALQFAKPFDVFSSPLVWFQRPFQLLVLQANIRLDPADDSRRTSVTNLLSASSVLLQKEISQRRITFMTQIYSDKLSFLSTSLIPLFFLITVLLAPSGYNEKRTLGR